MRRTVGIFAALLLATGIAVIGLWLRSGAGPTATESKPPTEAAPPAPPAIAPQPPASPLPAAVVTPTAAATPSAAQPGAAPSALLGELSAVLIAHGYKKPIAIVDSRVVADRLTLILNPQFGVAAQDLTALDELVAALSNQALEHGYRHLELRVRKTDGSIVPLDALVMTPPARRPQPDPIDDGVRR